MIQKKYSATWERKEPYKFIPRRDLFPDAVVPADWDPPGPTITGWKSEAEQLPVVHVDREEKPKSTSKDELKNKSDEKPGEKRREKPMEKPKDKTRETPVKRAKEKPKVPERTYNTPVHRLQNRRPVKPTSTAGYPAVSVKPKRRTSPEFLLLLAAGLLLLEPMTTGIKVQETSGRPQTTEMLKSIGPYLEDRHQDVAYTAAGVLEIIHLAKGIMNHTYQNQYRITAKRVPSDPGARKAEALRAIKPYIEPMGRRHLDRALNVYEGADQLQKSLTTFAKNHKGGENKRIPPLALAADVLNVIHPILPKEQKDLADKAAQVLKMVEVMGTANKAKKVSQSEEKEPNLMDSLTSMLGGDQKDSMNMIMKVAQLLAQPEQGTTPPDGQ